MLVPLAINGSDDNGSSSDNSESSKLWSVLTFDI